MINSSENIHRYEPHILISLLCPTDLVSNKGYVISKTKVLEQISIDSFQNPLCREFITSAKRLYGGSKNMPSIEDVLIDMNLRRKEHSISDEERNTFDPIILCNITSGMMFDMVYTFSRKDQYSKITSELISFVKMKEMTMGNADAYCNGYDTIYESGRASNVLMDDDYRSISNAKDLLQVPRTCKTTGDKYLDIALGGGWACGLHIFAGAPKSGKSTVMGYLASCCANAGGYVGIATLELGSDKYIKRVGSSFYTIPLENFDRYIAGDADEKMYVNEIQNFIDAKKSNHTGELGDIIIKNFPLGDTTASDIRDFFIRQETKLGIKFSLIIVDYLTLMNTVKKKNDQNSYAKIKEISENLRNMGMKYNWPIVTPMQLKPEFWNTDDIRTSNCVEESSGAQKTLDSMFVILPSMVDDPKKEGMQVANFERVGFECKFARDAKPYYEKHYYRKDFRYFRMIPETNVIPDNDEVRNINATPYGQAKVNVIGGGGLGITPQSGLGFTNAALEFDIKPNTAFESQSAFEDTSVFEEAPF